MGAVGHGRECHARAGSVGALDQQCSAQQGTVSPIAGRELIMTFRGRLTGTLTARNGVEHTTTTTSTLTLAVTIGGQPINNARVLPGAGTSTYTCNASSYIEHDSDGTETTWIRG